MKNSHPIDTYFGESSQLHCRRIPTRVARVCAALGVVGLALSGVQSSRADGTIPSLSVVVTNKNIPLNSAIFIDGTTAPEYVYFAGPLKWLGAVVAPSTPCTPASPCLQPNLMTVSTPGILGTGLVSGLRYTIAGISVTDGKVPVPGASVLRPKFVVIPPHTIKPTNAFVSFVTVPTVITLDDTAHLLQAAAPPSGLVSWYQAEGTAADAMGLNPGTLSSNETVTFVPGKIGQAFRFQGQGFVEVASSPSLQSPTVTVAAWIHAPVSPGPFKQILTKGASTCNFASYALDTGASGGLRFYISDGVNVFASPDGTTGVWDGNWHLAVGTFDGTAVHLYIDGVEKGSGTPAPVAINYSLPNNDKLYIGAYRGTCELRFTGDVDEVQVYARALLAAEVLGLYNASP